MLIMNTQEFYENGIRILEELKKSYTLEPDGTYQWSRPLQIPIDTAYFEEKLANLKRLLNDVEVTGKIEKTRLLERLSRANYGFNEEQPNYFPDDSYPLLLSEEDFTKIYDVIVELSAADTWQNHFAENFERYLKIWRYREESIRHYLQNIKWKTENLARREEEKAEKLQSVLLESKEILSRPHREPPCLAERRKNGLACNRENLVLIKALPPMISKLSKTEISIKRCRECWQIYKEFFIVNELNQQFISRLLMPDETDNTHGFGFSKGEAEEYLKIDFVGVLNPNLKLLDEIR